jgi:hypothetical protein
MEPRDGSKETQTENGTMDTSIEQACKAYYYRTAVQASVKSKKLEAIALAEIEKYPLGSEAWKAAVKELGKLLNTER